MKLSKSYIKQGYRLTISQGNTSTTATLSVDDVDEVCAFLASTVPTAYVPALPSVTVHRVYKVEGRP